MSIKRAQGRPKQGDSQVGRERIISGFIEMVRSGCYDDISRKQIADNIGITPALITYYFPKGNFLVKEAFTPVFRQWYAEFDQILSERTKIWNTRLVVSLELIIDMYRKDMHVERVYKELCRKGIIDRSNLDAMKVRLAAFLAETVFADETQSDLSETVANVIWGACEHCAPMSRSDVVLELIERIVEDRPRRVVSSDHKSLKGGVPAYRIHDRSAKPHAETQSSGTSLAMQLQRESRVPSESVAARTCCLI